MKNTDQVAEHLYTVYSAAVGGVAFNGDPLPAWVEFSVDPKKEWQANAWRATAMAMMMSEFDAVAKVRAALAALVGASSKEELEALEAALRMMPAPAADKAVMIDAIHSLLATLILGGTSVSQA